MNGLRSVTALALALSVCFLTPQGANAKNPCKQSGGRQLNMQIHQLDGQRKQIQRQYRGPQNAVARRNALAQIDAQRDGLEAQKRNMKERVEECKEAHGRR